MVMSPASENRRVRYLIFDVEAVADGQLIANCRYPDDQLTPSAAIQTYRSELMEQYGKDVMPATFMLPCAVAVAKVDADCRLLAVTSIDAERDPSGETADNSTAEVVASPATGTEVTEELHDQAMSRGYQLARRFWEGWKVYRRPTLVTFNGRGYDLPVLELAAYRYGLSIPEWFNVSARSFEQSRNRYNLDAHWDLMEILSNYSAYRMTGGLNLLANIIGKPGKTGIDGSKIQDMFAQREWQAISSYCCCDALDTYFVFLRVQVLIGGLTLDQEQERVAEAKLWVEQQTQEAPQPETRAAYTHYLHHWGDWQRPQ